jgi:Mor family transcriptional regulator
MNTASSRMPALDRAPSSAPRFNPFAAAIRHTLYDQIGDSIGGDAADKLIADFGGRRFYVPRAPAPGDPITRSIGLRAALAMAREFGGDRILVPVTSSHARRRVRIVAMRADHVSISRIARELRCTERYVYKVLSLTRAPETPATHVSPASLFRDCPPSLEGRGRGSGSSPSSTVSTVHSVPPTSAPIAERLKRGHINQRS